MFTIHQGHFTPQKQNKDFASELFSANLRVSRTVVANSPNGRKVMNTILKYISLPLLTLLASVSIAAADVVVVDPGHCIGVPTACTAIPDGKCANQKGCFPKQSDLKCVGTALECDSIAASKDCDKQAGCSWSP